MLSLASKLLNLAVSSQDCTRNDLRRSKIQNFPGGGLVIADSISTTEHGCDMHWNEQLALTASSTGYQ